MTRLRTRLLLVRLLDSVNVLGAVTANNFSSNVCSNYWWDNQWTTIGGTDTSSRSFTTLSANDTVTFDNLVTSMELHYVLMHRIP